MEYQPYPKTLYHRTEEPRVVADPLEHAALGPGWEETPAAFADEPEAPVEPAPTPRRQRKAKS